jgi:predicted DNA-binding transcriptional regulator AlpA
MPARRPRLRSVDVARYLGVSHQRVTQMVAEGKLPTPRRDHLGASWTEKAIERWAERYWWGKRPWRIDQQGEGKSISGVEAKPLKGGRWGA